MNSSTTTVFTRYIAMLMLGGAVLLSGLAVVASRAHAQDGSVPPVISSVAASPSDTGATITWLTDQAGTSQVRYGLSSVYNASSTLGTATTTSHTSFLGGLTPNTTYHFQVVTGNASGTIATSSDMTFMTTNSASTTASTTSATTTSGATSTTQIMIMKHLCNASIHNLQDFEHLGAGKGPVATLAADVLACPTTGLVGNAAVANTVASPRSNYNFTVTTNAGSKTLSANGTYMPHKLCESDLNLDVDGNGQISSTTCLDISHYQIAATGSTSPITVTESAPPAGFRFGAVRFTPAALDNNNDAASLVSTDASTGTITLNASQDTDGMIMLHVYNFPNMSTSTGDNDHMGTSTDRFTLLQMQITQLEARISALEAAIAGLWGSDDDMGSTTASGNTGGGTLDQSNITVNAGGVLNFGGRSFPREENITITLNGAWVAAAHADGGGNFSSGSLTAPSAPGTYTYIFTGSTGDVTHATVTVR